MRPIRPVLNRADMHLRLAGHSRTAFQTCPVYVTANPRSKFTCHMAGRWFPITAAGFDGH